MLIESVLLTYCIKMGEHCLAIKRCTLLTSFVIRVTPKLVAIRSLTILKSFSPLVLRGTFPPFKTKEPIDFSRSRCRTLSSSFFSALAVSDLLASDLLMMGCRGGWWNNSVLWEIDNREVIFYLVVIGQSFIMIWSAWQHVSLKN